MIEGARDKKLFISKWTRRREQVLPFTYIYMCVSIYLLVGGMTKSLEKSLRLEITIGHRATQKMSLSILPNPEGSSIALGGKWAGGVTTHRGFRCRAPLGFWCRVLAALDQVLGLSMTFMYSSCSADHGQGEFSC